MVGIRTVTTAWVPDEEDIQLTWNRRVMRAQNKPLLSSAGESRRMFVTVV